MDQLEPRMHIRRSVLIGLPIVSGLLLWASFWVDWLVFLGLVPVSLLARLPANRRWIYFGAWLGGLAFFLPGVQWLRHCDPSAWLGWLLLALYLSLYFPLYGLGLRVLHRRWRTPLLFAVPITWVALEYVRMHLLSGFGWLLLAHSLCEWTRLIQIADFAGVFGVSFFAAFLNGCFAELLALPLVVPHGGAMVFNPALRWRTGLTLGTIVAVVVYGSIRIRVEFEDGPKVLLIQSNLKQSLKNEDAEASFRHIRELTLAVTEMPADLVVWPETSYPYFYGNVSDAVTDAEMHRLWTQSGGRFGGEPPKTPEEGGKLLRESLTIAHTDLRKLTDQIGKPLLVGTIRHDFQPGLHRQYNSSVLFAPQRGPVAQYDKIHLVPFGEYLPLKEALPILKRLVPYDADTNFGLNHATEFQTLHYNGMNFASLICFEDTLPHLAREFARRQTPEQPVDFFVNQSNDGWFQGSIEADYHLAASTFRCIECRTPMVRVSNTGITAVVDGNGRLTRAFERAGARKLVEGHLEVVVPLDKRWSLYVTLGDWLPQLCLLIVAAGLLAELTRWIGLARKTIRERER